MKKWVTVNSKGKENPRNWTVSAPFCGFSYEQTSHMRNYFARRDLGYLWWKSFPLIFKDLIRKPEPTLQNNTAFSISLLWSCPKYKIVTISQEGASLLFQSDRWRGWQRGSEQQFHSCQSVPAMEIAVCSRLWRWGWLRFKSCLQRSSAQKWNGSVFSLAQTPSEQNLFQRKLLGHCDVHTFFVSEMG